MASPLELPEPWDAKRAKRCIKWIEVQGPQPISSEAVTPIIEALERCAAEGDLQGAESLLAVLALLAADTTSASSIGDALPAISSSFESFFDQMASLDTARELEASLLTLLLRVTSKQLGGADLLEACSGSIPVAVDCILATLQQREPSHKLLAADHELLLLSAARLLHELTLPQTYFLAMEAATGYTGSVVGVENKIVDPNAISIAELTALFSRKVTALSEVLLRKPLLQALVTVLKPWIVQRTAARQHMRLSVGGTDAAQDGVWHALAGHAFGTCRSLFTFSTQHSAKLRSHLAMGSGIMEQVILPYTQLLLTMRAEEAAALLPSLRSSLALVCVACFKVRALRPRLRDGSLVTAALASPAAADVYALAPLIVLVVNCDMLLLVGAEGGAGGGSGGSGAAAKPGIKANKKEFGPATSPLKAAEPTAAAGRVNYALLALIRSAVDRLDETDRVRCAHRLQDSADEELAAVPMQAEGTSYAHLKELWESVPRLTRSDMSVPMPVALAAEPESKEADATAAESVIVPAAPAPEAESKHEEAPVTTAAAATTSKPIAVPLGGAPSLAWPAARARHHLPPMAAAVRGSPAAAARPPDQHADFFVPRCALTGRIMTDPVYFLLPSSAVLPASSVSSESAAAARVRGAAVAAPGSYVTAAAASESKDESDAAMRVYCDREAGDDVVALGETGSGSGEESSENVLPLARALAMRRLAYTEPADDDAVLVAVKQWQLRKMMGER